MSRIGCSSSTRSTRGRYGLGRALAGVPVSFLTELINLWNLPFCSQTCTHCSKLSLNYNKTAINNPEGVTMSNFDNALRELRARRSGMQVEVEKLDQIITGIESLNDAGVSHTAIPSTRKVSAASRRKMALAQRARWASLRMKSQPVAAKKTTVSSPAKRTMSAAARRKISLAQKARWAKAKGQAPKPKHKISAAGRARIAAATRARWAKVRAQQKKAA